jgi:hypothetical protein
MPYKNPEDARRRNAVYRATHKKEIAAKQKVHRTTHKKEIAVKQKVYDCLQRTRKSNAI